MLSYQHAYHAGNLADVHKHAALAWALGYLTAKPKPISYIETHAGRALYDLNAAEAQKTQEAAAGIEKLRALVPGAHPYARALAETQASHGAASYPGSPLVARHLLRDTDRMTLAELHPQEAAALRANLPGARVVAADGPELAVSICPPDPRRGLLLIDPSYEVKTEWRAMPTLIGALHRKWNVGVIMLWYPILTNQRHRDLTAAIKGKVSEYLQHEVRFAPARPGHGMVGSGLIVLNPPWGMEQALSEIESWISQVSPAPAQPD